MSCLVNINCLIVEEINRTIYVEQYIAANNNKLRSNEEKCFYLNRNYLKNEATHEFIFKEKASTKDLIIHPCNL